MFTAKKSMIRVAVDGLGRSALPVEVFPRTHDKSSTAALLMVAHPSSADIVSSFPCRKLVLSSSVVVANVAQISSPCSSWYYQ